METVASGSEVEVLLIGNNSREEVALLYRMSPSGGLLLLLRCYSLSRDCGADIRPTLAIHFFRVSHTKHCVCLSLFGGPKFARRNHSPSFWHRPQLCDPRRDACKGLDGWCRRRGFGSACSCDDDDADPPGRPPFSGE